MSNTKEDFMDFQAYLQTDELANRRDHSKVLSILLSVTGTISIIGSSATIWHILRSHKGLSLTYHRLVLGLCIGDLMSSSAYAFNSVAAPKEFKYLAPSANGTFQTCSASGFFLLDGLCMATSYTQALCFYYLAIITYNKKDNFIKAKLEPWSHGIPVTNALTIGILGLILEMFNIDNDGGMCMPTPYLTPHCDGYKNGVIPDGFSTTCGRGDTKRTNLLKLLIHLLLPLTSTPLVIVGTMVAMYRTVRKIEHKMFNYGASALRLRAQQRQGVRAVDNDHAIDTNCTFISRLKSSMCPCLFQNYTESRSNNARSQKRAVLYMAMSYSLTWALVFVPITLRTFVIDNNRIDILVGICQPLQRLYSFLVYMSPKVRHARNTKRRKLPWCRAFMKAWMSRGEKDRTICSSRRQFMRTSRAISSILSLPSRLHSLRNRFATGVTTISSMRNNMNTTRSSEIHISQVVERKGNGEEKEGELMVRNQIMVGTTMFPPNVEKIGS